MRPPDKFNMVDMEGVDLLEVQGETIPGLYNKLVESIAQCRYQCVYNWAFNGILIPPTYVEMEERSDGVWINEGVMVDEEDVVHISSIEPEPPTPVEPVIESLSVIANGIYTVPSGVDGFNPVDVSVPSIAPVIQSISITQNGTVVAPEGIDGYSPIVVDVAGGGNQTYSGTSIPSSELGVNGDWYIQTIVACEINSLAFDTGVDGLNVYGFKFHFKPLTSLHNYQSYLVSVLDNFTLGQKGNANSLYLRIRSGEKLSTTAPDFIEIEAIEGAILCSNGATGAYDGSLPLSSLTGNVKIGALTNDRYSDFAFVSLTLYDSTWAEIDTFTYDQQLNAIIGSNGSLPSSGTGTISSYGSTGMKSAYHKENGVWVKY